MEPNSLLSHSLPEAIIAIMTATALLTLSIQQAGALLSSSSRQMLPTECPVGRDSKRTSELHIIPQLARMGLGPEAGSGPFTATLCCVFDLSLSKLY